MSTDPDRKSASPDELQPSPPAQGATAKQNSSDQETVRHKPEKGRRKVSFPPEDAQLVTEYFEPANPWHDVPATTREHLVAEYLESCRRHHSPPMQTVLEQIQDLPESAIGGAQRAPRLTLGGCPLAGAAPIDALEAVLRRVQFRRLEVDYAELDDESAEALFDMIEYYESATILSIAGPRGFGVRGWQAASGMIKKSAELSELEVHSWDMKESHCAVLARALRPHSCRLRALALQRAALAGEPLLCLVIALKSNSSIRELRLGDNELTSKDATQLAALLRANALIQLLDLSNNHIQDAGVGQIADALVHQAAHTPPSAATSPMSPHHCPLAGYESRGLAFLVLWNNQLTRNCAHYLNKALRSSASLCVLNVGRNALGSDTLNSLHGPALVSLGLQAARLGHDAARPLAELIRHSPRLQRLDLRDNKLDSGALQAVQLAMKDNRTLMQIDLDDTTDPTSTLTADASTAATCARLTREIRALCQRNEPLTSAHRVHRKISLTCRSACLQPSVPEEERKGGRLRSPAPSPAPSPAGSPVPGASPHSRFSVTRVTPERESSTSSNESGSPSTPSPSRFRVMQVPEPPQIHVQPAEPRRSASRFSVTRNYDTIYNPTPTPSAASLAKPDLTAKDSVLVARAAKEDGVLMRKDGVLTVQKKDSACDVLTSEEGVPTVQKETSACGVLTSKDNVLRKVQKTDSACDVLTSKDSVLTVQKESSTCGILMSKEGVLTMQKEPSACCVLTSEDCVLTVQKEPSTCDVLTSKDCVLLKVQKEDSACDVLTSKDGVLTVQKESTDCGVLTSKDCVLTVQKESSACNVLTSKESSLVEKVAKEVFECEVLTRKDSVVTIKAAETAVDVPKCDVLVTKVPDDVLVTKDSVLTVKTVATEVPQCDVLMTKARVLTNKALEVATEAPECNVPSTKDSVLMTKGTAEVPGSNVLKTKDSVLTAKTAKVVAESDLVANEDNVNMLKSPTVATDVPKYDILVTEVPDHGVLTSNDSILMAEVANDATRLHKCETSVLTAKVATGISECEVLVTKDSVLIASAAKPTTEIPQVVLAKDNVIVTKASTESDVLKSKSDSIYVIKPVEQNYCKVVPENSALLAKNASCATKCDVKVMPDVAVAKDDVAPRDDAREANVKAQKLKSETEECKEKVPLSRNEEQSSTTVVQCIKDEIQSANDLHYAEEVIVTAVIVQEPKPNIQIAREVESTACTSEMYVGTADTRIAQHVPSNVHIEKRSSAEIQNVENIVQASKERGDSEARSDDVMVKSVSSEASRKCVNISDMSVTSDDRSDSTISEASDAPIVESAVRSGTTIGDSDRDVKTDGNSDGNDKSSTYKDKTEQIYHDERRRLVGDKKTILRESTLLANTTEVSETDRLDVKVEVSVKLETDDGNCENKLDSSSKTSVSSNVNNPAKVHPNQNAASEKQDHRSEVALRQFEAITQDLSTLIQDMQSLSTKPFTRKSEASIVQSDYTQTDAVEVTEINTVTTTLCESVTLKKNKSESSLDSPDLEVSRLMTRKPVPYCDSSSSYSGSSMESLTAGQTRPSIVERTVDTSLDRRKAEVAFSTESSLESSDATPINSTNLLNTSMSSQDSVSPIFGVKKKIHGSLSSLEASVSSLDSARGTERLMVISADSGIEYSLQQPSDSKEDSSSNEGTLTNTSSLKDTAHSERGDFLPSMQDTLTSPKRVSSLLDVPALKGKSAERTRKISFVAPSASFVGQKPEEPKESKLPTNLEKLLSLFHNPGSLFSRSNSQNEDERKSASNTPPRKEAASLSSSFWTWGNLDKGPEREEDRGSSPENTDSTLSERVQVSYVDESFSKKLDSKTPSTDTDNTLSEFQSSTHCTSDGNDVTIETTDDNIVQNVDLSVNAAASPNDNGTGGQADLSKPNDMNRNVYDKADEVAISTDNKPDTSGDAKAIDTRPRSFAAVLKSSATENTDRQASPDSGQSVEKLPSKVIRGIKENISPENTLTSSMTNTKTLALELNERQIKNQPIVNAVWEIATEKGDAKSQEVREQIRLEGEAAKSADTKEPLDTSIDSGVTSLDEQSKSEKQPECREIVDLGKDALSYLIYENQNFEPDSEPPVIEAKTENLPVLAEELRDADLKNLDLSPELVIDLPTNSDLPEVFAPKDLHRASPIAPERAKIKSNSLEDLSQRLHSAVSMETAVAPKSKPRNIVFNVPEASGTTPRDIPERRTKLRSRSGSSPKSLPESLNKPAPISKLESVCKKKKKVSSLGKMARDSLLALNRTEDEIADIRREYKLTSVESLRSLESVSEDANSQSGNSADSRCRCLRGSQESLMSLDSISEDCRCDSECDKSEGHAR